MTNQQYEDLTLRELALLCKLFESAGAGPAFVRQLEERAHMLPLCIEAVQKLLDEDKYDKPQLVNVNVGMGWHAVACDSVDFRVEAKVIGVRLDESLSLAFAITPCARQREGVIREVIVKQDEWSEVAYGIQARQHKRSDILIRFPRREPLFKQQTLAQVAQQ